MPGTVIIVEDEPIVALDAEQALTSAGFEVVGVAHSEHEAVDIAAASPPSYAVVDVNLAPGDGVVVAETLTDHGTAVLMATSDTDHLKTRKPPSGALAAIPKPYQSETLVAAVEALARLSDGETVADLPDHMIELPRRSK